jgi:drug/metabolite transporter (DMT)-like permease
MTAVLLALVSAACFGSMTVAIRIGLRGGGAATGALAMLVWGATVATVAALPRHDLHRAWEFLLAGLIAPGCSQVLFNLSVREAGPSRTSVTVGAAPLVAVAIALVALDEPVRVLLIVGALLVVGGGVVLAGERNRPEHVRRIALLYAVGATVFFAVRDNIVRALHAHASPETAAAATFLGGLLVTLVWARRPPGGRELRRLAPAGILFGLSYVCLFEAYFHGRVSVVSPLVSTESLWGVGLSLLAFRGSEGVGRRVVVGALLVVAGGVLIGAFR